MTLYLPVRCPQEKEPRLPGLLKMLLWAQGQLDEKVVYPHIDLATGRLTEDLPVPSSTACRPARGAEQSRGPTAVQARLSTP